MAKKSKPTAQKDDAPQRINCEDCRHFNGSAFWFKFGCAKSHEAQESWSFKRDACVDNSPLRRDELILKRFDSLFGTAPTTLKNKKSSIRRTASSLRSAMKDFEKVLDREQVDAIKTAANAFDRLGDDVDRAVVLAKKAKAEREAKWRREHEAKLDAIAAEYFGIAGDQKVLEIAKDMDSFTGREGQSWFASVKGKDAWVPGGSHKLYSAIDAFEKKPSSEAMQAVKREFAESLGAFRSTSNYALTAKVEDFEKFRIWRAQQRELQRLAKEDPTIVILKPQSKGKVK